MRQLSQFDTIGFGHEFGGSYRNAKNLKDLGYFYPSAFFPYFGRLFASHKDHEAYWCLKSK
jgi:hypothetical protein